MRRGAVAKEVSMNINDLRDAVVPVVQRRVVTRYLL
jgi:hypothetical protein